MSRVALVLAGSVLAACSNHPASSLVRVDREPAGANCPNGGTIIQQGKDRDRDGTLDDHEVSSTTYICDAATAVKCVAGENNTKGPVTLSEAADFAAIGDVSCIDGDLMIVGSDLVALPALPNLAIVTGSIVVAGNSMLESLDGLHAIRDVGRRYVVQGNDSLTSLTGLGALKRFQGLAIIGNDALVDVAALETFTELDGGLQISNNSSLTSLRGLENVTRGLRDKIVIASNKNLTSVAALASLRSAVLIEIVGNAALSTVALPSLERVDVYLLVKDHAALQTLALPTLFTTGGLLVRSNPALTSVSAPELVLSGAVSFEHDTSLGTVSLPKLAYTTGDFDMNTLPQLASAALPSLVAIGGRLYLYQLPVLSSLGGFSALSSVGGNFTLQAVNSLQDFTGLSSLVDVADMRITQNAELTSFAGLDAFEQVGGDLVITNNPKLPPVAAQTFAGSITVVGAVTIN